METLSIGALNCATSHSTIHWSNQTRPIWSPHHQCYFYSFNVISMCELFSLLILITIIMIWCESKTRQIHTATEREACWGGGWSDGCAAADRPYWLHCCTVLQTLLTSNHSVGTDRQRKHLEMFRAEWVKECWLNSTNNNQESSATFPVELTANWHVDLSQRERH